MPEYIFAEEEWLRWSSELYTDATLVGLDGQPYGQLIHRGLAAGLPGQDTIDTWIGVNTFGPGGVYESHDHETSQFFLVLSGTGKVRVGDEERIVEKGAWVFTPPGMPHYVENVGDEDFAYLLIGGNPNAPDSTAHTEIERHEHRRDEERP